MEREGYNYKIPQKILVNGKNIKSSLGCHLLPDVQFF